MSHFFNDLRERHSKYLAEEIERLVENDELDPENVDEYYWEQMEEFRYGYEDAMESRYDDVEF